MPSDAELMEASLIALAEAGVELRHPLFARWFAVWPERRATFINVDASSRRMTDETLEMMLGLAKGEEQWVGPLVDELAFTHRSYGRLPWEEYESWIDLTVEVVGEAAGAGWSEEAEAAWRRQAERLKVLLTEARISWDRAMPGHILGELPGVG
jgi:hemoglobin-like flavoprotein